MRLVVDTNRIVASMIKDSTSRAILRSDAVDLYTLGLARVEVLHHEQVIRDKAGMDVQEFAKLLSILLGHVHVVPDEVAKERMAQARGIMDPIDPDDTPFVALALAIENDGIWSDDRHFREQEAVPVWTTARLVDRLGEALEDL